MKNLLSYTAALLGIALTLSGCKKDEAAQLPAPEISVQQPKAYPCISGTYSVEYSIVNSREGVKLETTCNDEWITGVTADDKTVTFSLTENTADEERSGSITLDYQDAVTVTLGIRQKGFSETPIIKATEPAAFSYVGGPATISYTIVNPKDGAVLKASCSESWIGGITADAQKIDFTIEKNTSDLERTAILTLTYEDAEPLEITIKQVRANAVIALDEHGTANCYIVSGAGSYTFAAVKGNSTEKLGTPGENLTAEVLWETFGTGTAPQKGDLISEVSIKDNTVTFKTPDQFKKGNAVIAVRDRKSAIIWSWHIWLTDKPEDQMYRNNAGTMMDRNLGATSATPGDDGAIGLLYQWGRKDPFLGMRSIYNDYTARSVPHEWAQLPTSEGYGTIAYTILYPTTFIYADESNKYDWLKIEPGSTPDNTRWQHEKTIYDPCPPGYRVPDGGPEGVWAKAFGTRPSMAINSEKFFDKTNEGYNFGSSGNAEHKLTDEAAVCWYPMTGFMKGIYEFKKYNGNYWSCTSAENAESYCLEVQGNGNYYILSSESGIRKTALAVRCRKE